MRTISQPYFPFRAGSSANQTDTVVIPERTGLQAVIKRLYAVGAHANALVKAYLARASGRTTVSTTAAYDATAVVLVGDAATAKTLRGRVVTTGDFILVNTILHGWRLIAIGALGVTANGTINVSTLSGFDGLTTAISGTSGDGIVAGHEAYVIWSEDVISLALGVATVTYEYPSAQAENGRPAVVAITAGDATAHRISALAEYV